MQWITRGAAKRLAVGGALLGLLGLGAVRVAADMPGESHRGPLPPLTEAERALVPVIRGDIDALAKEIGPRHLERPDALERAARYLEGRLRASGLEPRREGFEVRGRPCANLVAESRGATAPDEIVIVGAHYDSEAGSRTPGADDNASGVAVCLALAPRLARSPAPRTVRFVLFVNEEPPYFQTEAMGSLVHARRSAAANEKVAAMLSLESLGCYRDEPGSQRYPEPLAALYPDTGNFVAFVGDLGSRALVRRAVGTFRQSARFPSEGAALPMKLPGVGWSDHWSFRQVGIPAVMVTATAPFRNPRYHTAEDGAETVDVERVARLVHGLEAVVRDLSASAAPDEGTRRP